MIAADGHTYEKASIVEHFKRHGFVLRAESGEGMVYLTRARVVQPVLSLYRT